MAVVAATAPNTAVIPVPQPGPNGAGVASNFAMLHDQNMALAKQGGIDVLFLGDSITDFWRNTTGRPGTDPANPPMAGKAVWDKYFGSLKVANFGISADRTQHVLWRLQNGEGAGFSPKVIVLMIGTNNTGLERDAVTVRNTTPQIVEGVTAVVNELRKRFADARILLLGIFPRGDKGTAQRNQVAEINQSLAQLNDGKHVFYLDIGAKFLDADGAIPPDVMADKLHPTQKGYEIWAEAMKPKFAQLLKDSGLTVPAVLQTPANPPTPGKAAAAPATPAAA